MQTYQSTPDFYRDYIEHKDHKYISKYRGPSGKWIYKYSDESQKSSYSDRKDQIKDSREHTEYESERRKYDRSQRRKYAYPDRARQIREGRERAKSKAFNEKTFSPHTARYVADRSGYTSKWTDKRLAAHDRLVANQSRWNAEKRSKARKSVNATTKGYGKSSTQPSKDALKNKSKIKRERDSRIRFRNAAAAERARKNRKAK